MSVQMMAQGIEEGGVTYVDSDELDFMEVDGVVNIENPALRAYMADSTYERETGPAKWNTVVYNYSKDARYGKNLDWPGGKLVTWNTTTPLENIQEIRITAVNMNFEDGQVGKVSTHNPDNLTDRSFVIRNLFPNCFYEYRVEEIHKDGSRKELTSGMFETVGKVRMIQVRNAHNVRDIGGWSSLYGATIKYGILYRSGSLETMNALGRHDFKDNLNVRAELDLRQESNLKSSRLGPEPDVKFRLKPHDAGSKGLGQNNKVYPEDLRWILGLIMPSKYSTNKNDQPRAVDWHCALGCDRCGAVSFLIEGLLGMSYVDLCRDFEISSFKAGYNRPRSHLGSMFKIIYNYGPKDDLARCFYNYWLSLGMTEEELDDFINHMLNFDDERTYVRFGEVHRSFRLNYEEVRELQLEEEQHYLQQNVHDELKPVSVDQYPARKGRK